ncbi:MAG: beta,4-mannosyltransferase, partial [Thermoleophilaceae bacterium]|nr:beta,4-mannosyltransferase [Thermoleophilaceae bacterium]
MILRDVPRGDTTYLDAVATLGDVLAQRGFHFRYRSPARPGEALLLAYTPVARMNPFQALLYSEAPRHGVGPLPVVKREDLCEIPWPGPMVCHFHWLASVLAGAKSDDEADDRIGEFAALLDDVRSQGRQIVWTVHNVLPHDSLMPEKEIELRRLLVDACTAIHVMAPETVDQVRPFFELPEERVFTVPHPSYRGAYPDHVSRADARAQLGIAEDEFVFLAFGAIQPYKGVEDLQEAFTQLKDEPAARPPTRLIVAGPASDAGLVRSVAAWSGARDDVMLRAGRIPNDDVQYLYRAADAAVLPYRRSLNSGAALLALTFGTPIVAPDDGVLGTLAIQSRGVAYDADADGLVAGLRSALESDLSQAEPEIRELVRQLAPRRISTQFTRELLKQ